MSVLALSASLISPVDLNRLVREVKNLDDFLAAANARDSGSGLALPPTSATLDDMIKTGGVNLLDTAARSAFIASLAAIKQSAPLIHISFAADPSPGFLQKIVTYLRREIHPQLLLQAGLQPSIGAGCIVRTTNRVFDFSLRKRLLADSDNLIGALKSGGDGSK